MNRNDTALARQILAQNERLLAMLGGAEPAKVTRPKAEPKARKAAKPAASKARKPPKATTQFVCKANRQAFVKAHPWAKGMSTQVIAAQCVEDPSLLAKGWAVGPRYTEMFSA